MIDVTNSTLQDTTWTSARFKNQQIRTVPLNEQLRNLHRFLLSAYMKHYFFSIIYKKKKKKPQNTPQIRPKVAQLKVTNQQTHTRGGIYVFKKREKKENK